MHGAAADSMTELALRNAMRAMFDAVLAGAFGVDSIKDLSQHQIQRAVSLWRDEIAEHVEAEAMERLIGKVVDEWPD